MSGRPRKDISELPENWKDIIITEMTDGATLAEIKAIFNISNDLHARWMNDEQEYSEAIKDGISLAEAWWLKQGRTNLQNKDFSATLWYMNMKNRFFWKDRQDITTNDESVGLTINASQAEQLIRARTNRTDI